MNKITTIFTLFISVITLTNNLLISDCFSEEATKLKFVRERDIGRGNFIEVSRIPIFLPTDGKGRGLPKYLPPQLSIKIKEELSNSKKDIMNIEYKTPIDNLTDILSETENDSGVFKNSTGLFTISLEPLIETDCKVKESLHVYVESSSVKVKQPHLNLLETKKDSLLFMSVPVDLYLKIMEPLNDNTVNSIIIAVVNDDSFTWSSTLYETDKGSNVFLNKSKTIKLTLKCDTKISDETEDELEINLESDLLPTKSICVLLKEDSPCSQDFSTRPTYFYQSTDIIPENPSTTGHGIFYIQVEGDLGGIEEVDVTISSEIETVIVKAYKLKEALYRTGKLVLMDYESNEDYDDIIEIKSKSGALNVEMGKTEEH